MDSKGRNPEMHLNKMGPYYIVVNGVMGCPFLMGENQWAYFTCVGVFFFVSAYLQHGFLQIFCKWTNSDFDCPAEQQMTEVQLRRVGRQREATLTWVHWASQLRSVLTGNASVGC